MPGMRVLHSSTPCGQAARALSRLCKVGVSITDTGAGTAQTAKKGISNLWLRLQSTIGGSFGPSFDQMDDLPTVDPYAAVDEPPALFSGDVCTQFPAGLDTDCFICYEQSLPLPATLVALITRLIVND